MDSRDRLSTTRFPDLIEQSRRPYGVKLVAYLSFLEGPPVVEDQASVGRS